MPERDREKEILLRNLLSLLFEKIYEIVIQITRELDVLNSSRN